MFMAVNGPLNTGSKGMRFLSLSGYPSAKVKEFKEIAQGLICVRPPNDEGLTASIPSNPRYRKNRVPVVTGIHRRNELGRTPSRCREVPGHPDRDGGLLQLVPNECCVAG